MHKIIAAVSLGMLVSACAMNDSGAIPAAEIDKMSGDQISVVYYDSVSGMGDATAMAKSYCDPMNAVPGKGSDAGGAPDKTVVNFQCRPIVKK